MGTSYDAIIVGGGHNGLTSAGYLGKAVLNSLLNEKIIQDLELLRHGSDESRYFSRTA